MTRKHNSANGVNWKELMAEQGDLRRPLIQEVLQQVDWSSLKDMVRQKRSRQLTGARVGPLDQSHPEWEAPAEIATSAKAGQGKRSNHESHPAVFTKLPRDRPAYFKLDF